MNTTDTVPAASAVDYDPFAEGTLDRVVPSTEPQREIWLADQLGRDASLAYNESVSLRLEGRLDVTALHGALQDLLDRHSALRSNLGPDGETLCVLEHVDLELDVRDVAAAPPDEREAAMAERRRIAVETPFALQHDRLFRAELLRLAEDDHLLILTAHHIVCDGWSWWVLVRELAALYATRSGRTVPPLPAADDFAAYALEQVAHPGGATFAADEAYWLSRFAGEVPVLDLPVDRVRPARRSFASSREDHVLDAGLVTALRAMGARRGVSLFAVLLTGFAGLLARLTGQSRVVVGIPTAGQSVDGHEHLVGHCVNTLPLLFDLDLAQPVGKALDDAQATLLDALEHQRYTFGTLLRKLHVARDPSRLPLVSVMLNIDQALDQETAAFPGLEMDFSSNARAFENFELSVNAVQAHGELRLECQYNRDLYDVDTVRRWLAYWQTLLQGMVAAGEAQAFGSLPLLAEADRRQLDGFNDTAVDYPRDTCIHELIEAQVARTPDAIALSHEGETLGYAELNARANRLAHHLRGLGVRPDDRVAICAERGPAMVTGLLAILKSGGAYVPFDPEYPPARLKGMLEDCQPVAILTEQALRGTVEALEPVVQVLALDADAADWAQQPATNPQPADAGLAATNLAYVIYTSGSTGTPKGAMNEHRGVVNRLLWMQDMFGLDAHDAVLQKTPFSFDVSVWEFFWPLLSGARLVMARAGGHKDPAYLADTVRREGITTMHFVPSMLRTFVDGADLGACTGLKRVVCSGEALPAKLADDVGRLLPGAGLHNLYGPTEAAVDVTAWTCVPGQGAAGVPIGRPVANTRIHILDQFGQPVPVGVAGEIFIGGVQVGRGYLNRAELTRERFLADPFAHEDGARMYKTGDLGRWRPDGNIEYLGRNDFQVKLRGFRIELGEIEKAIADHADIAQAVVVAREDHPGDVRLVAYVVPREGAGLDEAGMRAHLKRRLPDYMVPAHFVTIDALPLLANGKMDRKALPAPVVESVAAGSERLAPRDDRERRVAAAMEAVLALPELDVRDDFFALGGHSLLAAQLTARLSREFGIALSFRTLFDAPTIADLAAAIGRQMDSGAVPALQAIPHRATQDRAPLSLMQKRLWALDDLQPGRVTYNAPSAHRLRGHLDEAAFERAFREMMQRQAVMRTSMQRNGEDVEQVVAEHVPLQLFPAEDLSALPAERRDAELMQRMQALADTPFELSRAPLFSVRMFRMADDEHVLFFMPHHIIWDGWSFDILDAELSQLYAAFKDGKPSPLAPLPVSYGDFAAWHGQWLQGPQFEAQLAFWRERLAHSVAARPLPTDIPRQPGMSGAGSTEWIRVSGEATEAMYGVARAADATLNMALLSLYYVLLGGYSGQRDLVVGTPVRGRNQTEVESVMGFFNNLLPLHVTLDPALPFLDFVRQVKKITIDCFGHPDVPLEYLQGELKVRHGSGASALYQALFSFQDGRQRVTDWGGLQREQVLLFQSGATEDLGLWFLQSDSGMVGGIIYNTDILHARTARMLGERFQALLASVCADPSQTIGALNRADADSLLRVREWSGAGAPADASALLHALFEARADAGPDKVALRFGSWTTRYAEIEQRANRIAACLRKRGVGAGSLVGLCVEPGVNRVAGMLGVLKAGGTNVLLDPADPPARLKDILADAQVSVLVGGSALETALGWPRETALWLDADTAEIIAASPQRPAAAVDARPAATAFVVHGPAADGMPRGTGFSHEALAARLSGLRQALGVSGDDRVLGTAPPGEGWSALECLLALTTGAEFVQASPREADDGEALAKLLSDSAATLMFASSAAWRAVLATGWGGAAGLHAVCTGGRLDTDLASRLAGCCAALSNTSGSAEAGVVATCGRLEPEAEGVHHGRPLPGASVWILDEDGSPCGIGVVGDIHVGGTGLGQPFGRRARAGERRDVPDPFSAGVDGSLVRTGFRGRWLAGGRVEAMGRADARMRIGGREVDRAGIEARILARPEVTRTAVVSRESRAGDAWLDAYVEAVPGAALDAAALRSSLDAILTAQEMPRHIVVLGALPVLPNGEVDVADLPVPSDGHDTASAAGDGLRTAGERRLAAIWQELLGVSQVTAADNFFDLGGHSLMAMELAAQVRRDTGVRLNLLDIATGNLASLAANLPEEGDEAAPVSSLGSRLRRLFSRQ